MSFIDKNEELMKDQYQIFKNQQSTFGDFFKEFEKMLEKMGAEIIESGGQISY